VIPEAESASQRPKKIRIAINGGNTLPLIIFQERLKLPIRKPGDRLALTVIF
jgi:hypothetical protein